MQNIILNNSAFLFDAHSKNDFKNLHENYTSTSLKEDSSKNFDEYEKNSSTIKNYELGNIYQTEGDSSIEKLEKQAFFTKKFEPSEKNIFLGKKIKIESVQVPINNNNVNFEINEKNIFENKKNVAKENEEKKQNKAQKTKYSVFKINKKFEEEKKSRKLKNRKNVESQDPQNPALDAIGISINSENKKFDERLNSKEEEISKEKQNKQTSSSFLSQDDFERDFAFECFEDSENENPSNKPYRLDKRVSAISKVNFTKLSDAEKDERLKNLAKMVKRLRRKVRNLENRFQSNANKILNKYLANNLGIKKQSKINQYPLDMDIDKLSNALKILRQYEKFEYSDQRHVIENLVNLIANEKLSLDSINFRKICTQIRIFLEKENSSYISNKGQKITFSFPESDINITTKEYELYSKYKDKEEIIRTIMGVPEESPLSVYPEIINFEPKKLKERQDVKMSNLQNNFVNASSKQNLMNVEQ